MQTTFYGYDAAGLLTQTTLPDGTVLKYSYDAAHRLTGVEDGAGNKITYVLDAMGNRVNEETRDPAGTLARTITRSYDALNRLQRIIGAAQ